MKLTSTILLTASAIAVLAAIWTPTGAWWQWTITAIILLLAGAWAGGVHDQRQNSTAQSDNQPPGRPGTPRKDPKPGESGIYPEGRSTGPHVHYTVNGTSADEAVEQIDQKHRQQDALNRPTYGKPSSKENNQS